MLKKIAENHHTTLFVVAALCAQIVGGPSFVVFVCSIAAVSLLLSRTIKTTYREYSLIFSVMINLSWLMFYLNFLVGRVYLFPFLKWMSVASTSKTFHPIPFFQVVTMGISQLGALSVVAIPGIASCIALTSFESLRHKSLLQERRNRMSGLAIAGAGLMPIIAIAAMRKISNWATLSIIMSGDGRNHFMWIEEIRVTSSIPIGVTKMATPTLGHGIAALLSAGNGSVSVLQKGDLVGILSVYTISISLLSMVAVGFAQAGINISTRTQPKKIITLSLISFGVVAISGPILQLCLQDGFMTLYFGIAVMSTILFAYYVASETPTYFWTLFLGLGCWVLIGSYSFLLPPAATLAAIFLLRSIWNDKNRLRKCCIGLGVLVIAGVGLEIYEKVLPLFKKSAILPGSVAPPSLKVLTLILVLGIVAIVVFEGINRWIAIGVFLSSFTTVLTVLLIEKIPGNEIGSYSYYSSKIIWGMTSALMVSLIYWIAKLIGVFLRKYIQDSTNRWRLTIGSFFSLLSVFSFLFLVESSASVSNPVRAISTGWISPDSTTVKEVISRWDEGPTLYFRFVDLAPRIPFPSIGQDRLANFWSPAFWGSIGSWGDEYNWLYDEFVADDVGVICPRLRSRDFIVVTRDHNLEYDVDFSCPATNTKFVVLPRLQS